jgi:CheY-like chemotaxis protein/signal transduction histidine kinase
MKKIIWLYVIGLITTVYARESMVSESTNVFWIWVALFILALIGIVILFISSHKTIKMQKLHQEMIQKQLKMEQNQNILLTNMSENIYEIAKKTLEKSHQFLEETVAVPVKNNEALHHVENRLLTVTNDLIDFLRLKSKKIQIIHEEFNLNNVLNEVSGSICSQYKGKDIELIFDINNNVPRLLIGDSLHLGQIINSILEHMMGQLSTEELKLEISMFNTFEEKIELQFQFSDTGEGISSEQLEALFSPYYDENSGAYVGLGLFVANELVNMMDGELTTQSQLGKGTTFTFAVQFDIVDKSNKRMYRLPEKILTAKKVFIVDNNYNSALAIKKMMAYFKHEVKVLSKEEFIKNMPNLTPYDIVVLHEDLFSIRLVEYLNKIKMGKELKVIVLNSLLRTNESNFIDDVIDTHLMKPVNQERIFEMIVGLYNINVPSDLTEEEQDRSQQVKTYKSQIIETKGITQSRFKDFHGKNLLIVEDNLINQKVLTNLLSQSDINISIANNGQEAVNLVKESNIEFDLVLMDINMPIMDGYTATQMIRLDHRFDGLPIVAFTALTLDSEKEKMFSSGINAFLSKPLNIGKLYTALAMYISESTTVSTKKELEETKNVEDTFKGLNVQEGIRHTNNSKALYMEVLREFNVAYGQSGDVFEKLVSEHRYEQIKMLCIDKI